jgi:hypothetical protein
LALALLACQRDNPAFDPDVGGPEAGNEDTGDASTTQTSTTQTSAGDGDGDTGDGDGESGDGDGDGDPTTDGPDSGMEAPIELDMPVAECLVETREGLWPRFGRPELFEGGVCPLEVGKYVRVVGAVNGHWLVNPCPNGCYGYCDPQIQYVFGADGLQVGLATLFPPVNFNQNTPWIGCYYIEAEGLANETDDFCGYSSLSAHTDEGPGSRLLFNANRDSWGLATSAALHYQDWTPEIADTNVTCECDTLDCCRGSTVIAKYFSLGDPVLPGEVGGVILNMLPYTFYAAQAQGGTNCEIDPETSWALWTSP